MSRIDWKKGDGTIQADSIQAIVTDAITGQGKDYIEMIPCSPQTIESLLPSIHDSAQIVCKAITTSAMELNVDDFSCPDPSVNPKCMTMLEWMNVQPEDKVLSDIIPRYKTKGLHKGKDTDSPEMKQFLKQRSKLLLRNGILYHKNDIQETDHPNRNTMQLVLPTNFRMQALKGCHDDLGHLGIEKPYIS